MSMIMQYVRIREDELAELRQLLVSDPDAAYDYVDELADEDDARGVDTDKAWAALAYLLERGGPPPIDPINGGERLTEDEWGYEPPRCLSAADVERAADHLARTPFDELARHFDPDAMATIYPEIWKEEWVLDYLGKWYESIRSFFARAAAQHDAVIIYLS